jgi:aminoacrylate hydrolase
MPEFDNHGATIHYELLGSGPPLLMIAGIASDSGSWAPLNPLLADRHRLIFIDNRGSGRTKAPIPFSLANMAGDCIALLDHLGIDQVDILAHSMGGIVAHHIAVAHPERVKRLVTMTSGAEITQKAIAFFDDMSQLYFELQPMRWFRLLYQWLFSEPFFTPDNVRAASIASALYPYRQSPENFAAQYAAIRDHVPQDVSRIACPVLAIDADLDIFVPTTLVRAVHAPIPNCRFETIPDAAHSIHWEQPEAVAKLVRAFLS